MRLAWGRERGLRSGIDSAESQSRNGCWHLILGSRHIAGRCFPTSVDWCSFALRERKDRGVCALTCEGRIIWEKLHVHALYNLRLLLLFYALNVTIHGISTLPPDAIKTPPNTMICCSTNSAQPARDPVTVLVYPASRPSLL